MQRREPNDESKPTAAINWLSFTNADPRYAGRLGDKQGGDTVVTMERERSNRLQCRVGRRVNMVVAHVGANGLSLETGRWGRARGESRGFRQQPKGT